jgi:hypothetical protein
VDQKWINLVPCYFDSVCILKHLGCNVAYWNLHERPLSIFHEIFFVGSKPLIFFHFSGININNTSLLSKHQNRFDLEDDKILKLLTINYTNLLTSNLQNSFSKIKYSYGYLPCGKAITDLMRKTVLLKQNNELIPFMSKLHLKTLNSRLFSESNYKSELSTTSLNLNESDIKIRCINFLIRLAVYIFGISRVKLLLQYCSFLQRGSNLAAVMSQSNFNLDHEER